MPSGPGCSRVPREEGRPPGMASSRLLLLLFSHPHDCSDVGTSPRPFSQPEQQRRVFLDSESGVDVFAQMKTQVKGGKPLAPTTLSLKPRRQRVLLQERVPRAVAPAHAVSSPCERPSPRGPCCASSSFCTRGFSSLECSSFSVFAWNSLSYELP